MRLITLLLLLTFVSCSSLDYNIPTFRMDTPETTGATLNYDVSIGGGSRYDIDLASAYDFIIDGIATEEAVNGPEPMTTFKFDLGLLERLDIGIQTYTDTTDILKLKYQFIGGNRSVTGFKMAAQLEYGFGYDESGELIGTTKVWDTELDADSLGLSVNIGYRPSAATLFYINTVYMEYEVSGNIKESGVQAYNDSQTPDIFMVLPGVRFDFTKTYLQLETGYSKLRGSYDEREDITYGMTFGYRI